ncbi:uncharacterized protein LOC143064382 isoform X2 [Mytilus galloprovincialis]|uniref:uncharacterized protein LOC143064382 isoform X2 n=1 Tax=Mytilus galloprovincialis TaxID=29158 RepID=UPI003F7C578A
MSEDETKNPLIVGIDNFFQFPLRVRMTTAIIPVGLIFLIGGLGSPSWSRSELSQLGLWKYCVFSDMFTCCDNLPGGSPGWVKATIVFHIFGMFGGAVCLLFTIFTMCVSNFKFHTRVHHAIWISSALTVFCLAISVGIFSANYHKESWLSGHYTSAGFHITVCACVVFLAICVAMLIFSFQDHNRVQDISNYMTPINWTKYNQDRSLEAWLSHIDPRLDKIEINEASTREKDAIVQLISRTWKPHLAGKGRDAQQRGYSQMKVVKVERIENPSLFLKYAQNRHDLLRRLDTTNRPFKFPGMTQHGPIETTVNMNKNVFADIYPEINEHYLFHGTSDATVRAIAYGGLDARLAGDGMFGRGIYAAECPTKSDHYTGTDMTNLKMIVVRMLLGEIYVTNVQYSFKKPPCKQCVPGHLGSCDKLAHKQGIFDSVMAAIYGKHREFITYEQNSCSSYPEYIITYNRE